MAGSYPLPDPTSSKAQEIGSAITYAKRYALSSVVGIVPDEDDDGQLAQQARHSRSGGKPKAQTSARQSQPQPSRPVDPETGEIQEPPNVQAAIEKLSQDGRRQVLDRMKEKNYPEVDALPAAAAKQVIKWAEEIKAEQDKGAPSS